MNPKTPANPGSAMVKGGTFVRPGAVAWGFVVPAAELARLLPAGMGIALNPGAGASVPIYPEGVGYLAAALVLADGAHVRVGRPPDQVDERISAHAEPFYIRA